MKALDFPEKNQDIGKGQDQYETLPAKIIVNQQVPIWSAFQPSEEDIEKLKNGAPIWFCQLTFGSAFHPVLLTMDKPNFEQLDKEAEVETDRLIKELNEKHKKGEIELTKEQARQLREKIKGKRKGFKKGEKHLKVEKGGQNGSK